MRLLLAALLVGAACTKADEAAPKHTSSQQQADDDDEALPKAKPTPKPQPHKRYPVCTCGGEFVNVTLEGTTPEGAAAECCVYFTPGVVEGVKIVGYTKTPPRHLCSCPPGSLASHYMAASCCAKK